MNERRHGIIEYHSNAFQIRFEGEGIDAKFDSLRYFVLTSKISLHTAHAQLGDT